MEDIIKSAVQDSRVILKQHTTNRLSEVNELFGQLQEANMSMMKKEKIEQERIAKESAEISFLVDIYNLGGNTPTYNANTIAAQVVEGNNKEQQYL